MAEHCSAGWQREHARHLVLAERFIPATKTHRLPEDIESKQDARRAGQLFLDANLAILAAESDRLRAYDRGIVKEWGQSPDAPTEAFRTGRRQALEQLAQQVPLFLTPEFEYLTPAAQANLHALVKHYA